MNINIGYYVTHETFGYGKVVEISSDFVWVDFPGYDIKKFSLSSVNGFLKT